LIIKTPDKERWSAHGNYRYYFQLFSLITDSANHYAHASWAGHFINHSQLEYGRTESYQESTRRVFMTMGIALFSASMLLMLNFSAYLASLAKVYVNMGVLIPADILSALCRSIVFILLAGNPRKPAYQINKPLLNPLALMTL
jgi:hypothetical protein